MRFDLWNMRHLTKFSPWNRPLFCLCVIRIVVRHEKRQMSYAVVGQVDGAVAQSFASRTRIQNRLQQIAQIHFVEKNHVDLKKQNNKIQARIVIKSLLEKQLFSSFFTAFIRWRHSDYKTNPNPAILNPIIYTIVRIDNSQLNLSLSNNFYKNLQKKPNT